MDEFVPWLRQRIRERLYLATHAVELGSFAEWEERSSGVLVTGDGTDSDPWRGTWVTGDSSVTRLMEANDPRDTIARCEAELAILDEYEAAKARREAEAGDYGAWVRGENLGPRPTFDGPSPDLIAGLERSVRLIGCGYRFWDGYRAEWKP
jgi:hypothetical protein